MANNDMLKSKADQALIMRESARMGQGARAADIINATDQQLGNAQNVNNRMLQARQQALQEYSTRLQQHQQQYGVPMQQWAQIMQQGGEMPNIPNSTINQALSAQMTGQQQQMNQAFNQGTQGVSSAMTALASAAGKSPDFGPIVSAFAKMKFGGSQDNNSYDTSGGMMDSGSSVAGSSNDAGYNATTNNPDW